MPKPIFFPKDLLVEETAQAAKEDQIGAGKSTSTPQRAQIKITKDKDPSGCASKLILYRDKK